MRYAKRAMPLHVPCAGILIIIYRVKVRVYRVDYQSVHHGKHRHNQVNEHHVDEERVRESLEYQDRIVRLHTGSDQRVSSGRPPSLSWGKG